MGDLFFIFLSRSNNQPVCDSGNISSNTSSGGPLFHLNYNLGRLTVRIQQCTNFA